MSVSELLRKSVPKVFPGAALCVFNNAGILFEEYAGSHGGSRKSTAGSAQSVYDIASLTKVVCTTALCMKAFEQGSLSLDADIAEFFPDATRSFSIKDILSHSAGFRPVAEVAGKSSVKALVEKVLAEEACYEPGTKSVYSDVGFIVLGLVLEKVFGCSLEEATRNHVLHPLGLKDTGWKVGDGPQVVPSSVCPQRGYELCGEVNDAVCFYLGGVAGHAGLFSTARDVAAFGQKLLNAHQGKSAFLTKETLSTFWGEKPVKGSTWVLGWDTPNENNSSAGKLFSPHSVGHLAYTGCSLWIDLERSIGVVLLSNRVWPDEKNLEIKKFRPLLHDAVINELA